MRTKLIIIFMYLVIGINNPIISQWEPVGRLTNESINRMFKVNDNDIWAVGNTGLILHYNGNEWQKITLPFLFETNLSAIYFSDANHGFVAGQNGMLLKYIEGDWQYIPSNISSEITDIYINSQGKGWLSSYNLYYYDGNKLNVHILPGGDVYLYDLHFLNDSTGWALGYRYIDSKSVIYKYNGISWSIDTAFHSVTLFSIFMLDNGTGWTCGNQSNVYYFDGTSWEKQIIDSSYNYGYFTKVYFTNPQHGWIFGNYAYVSYEYKDGKWNSFYNTVPFSDILETNTSLWATSIAGDIFKYENNNWVSQYENYSNLIAIRSINKDNIWVIANNAIYKYKNDNLIADTIFQYNNITNAFFLDSTNGFAIGYGSYWKYKNGVWQNFNFNNNLGYPTLFSNYFIDTTLGWAVGYQGVILKYDHGNWFKETSPTNSNLRDVWFTDASNGWAVGENGTILKYSNGSWSNYPKITNKNLISVCFSSPTTGWAVGENQTILQFNNNKWQVYTTANYGDYYNQVTYTNGKWLIVGSNGKILMWNDSNWEYLPTNTNQNFRSIALIDSLNGIAISYAGLFKTTTGGKSPYQSLKTLEIIGTYSHPLILNNDTIKVLNNININGSLILKDNVKVVEFEGPYNISINGSLYAVGKPSNPIQFKVADTIISGSNNKWDRINISSSNSDEQSVVNYCNFSYAQTALVFSSGKFSITNSSFFDNQTAINTYNITEANIENNVFDNNSYNSLSINQSQKITIKNNQFIKHQTSSCMQVYTSTKILISKNLFTKNDYNYNLITFSNSDAVIELSKIVNNNSGIYINNSNLTINNCLIANNNYQSFYESQSFKGLIFVNNSLLNIINSNIVNNKDPFNYNSPGAAIIYRFSSGDVYNSILWNNYFYDFDSASLQPYQIYVFNNTSRPNFYYSNIQGGINGIRKAAGVTFLGNYTNNHSNNPQFISPTTSYGNGAGDAYNALNANWALAETSPNINTGSTEIGLLNFTDIDLNNNRRILNGVVDIGAYENKVKPIEYLGCDTIKNNTIWATDTVRIKNCNIVIAKTAALTIKPGTMVEFWGPYKIIVQGSIKATGTKTEPVVFTSNDTSNLIGRKTAGWKGIEIDNSTGLLDDNDSSIFDYCIFRYAKDTIGYYYNSIGIYGVIKAKYFGKLRIANSLFENNICMFDSVYYQGASVIALLNARTVKLENNRFINNSGSILRCDYSSIWFTNNLVYKNTSSKNQNLLAINTSDGYFYKNFLANNKQQGYYSLLSFNSSNSVFNNNVIVNNADSTPSSYSNYLITGYGGRLLFHNNTIARNFGYNYFYAMYFNMQNNIWWDDSYLSANGLNEGSVIKNNILKNAYQYGYYDYFINNMDNDPLFTAPSPTNGSTSDGLQANWQLSYFSPAINAGSTDTIGLHLPKYDMADNKRLNGDAIDLGAYEHTGSKVQFTLNPKGGNYCNGDSAVLICSINNQAQLQWLKDGVEIPNATDSILILLNLSELNSGNYVCKATNAYGTTYSNPAFIQVAVAPELISQPSTQWLEENENDEIFVTASGTKPLKYYWYFRSNLIDSTLIGKLTINNASVNNEGTYYCEIKNYCGTVETQPFGVYLKPKLCLVTADTETGKNVIVWERQHGRKIKGYNVYRESIVKDVYEKLGFVPYDQVSVFVDSSSKPESRQYLYKIAIVAENNEVSPLSPYHKTLFLQYVSSVEGVNLIWQPYTIENGNAEFSSYVLYKGTDSTQLQPFDTVSSNITAYTDKDPQALQRLTFYRVAGILYNPCHSETLLKAGGGPFVEALSNIEDNRLRATSSINGVNIKSLSLFPQPASNILNIAFYIEKPSIIHWEIIDITGSILTSTYEGLYLKGNHTLQINLIKYKIKSGTYFLKIRTNNGYIMGTFVVAK